MEYMDEERNESRKSGKVIFLIGLILGIIIGLGLDCFGLVSWEKIKVGSSVSVASIDSLDLTLVPEQEGSDTSSKDACTNTNLQALTLVSYSHNWSDRQAHLSVRNNTNQTITSFTGRIMYYDMNGNMLDYMDFTQKLDIEAGMAKKFELDGYNHDEDFAYYKSEVVYSHPENKYKIKFIITSYTCQ